MYITNGFTRVVQSECPVVCGQPLQAHLSLLGAVFGIVCLASYLVRKRFFLHVRSKKKKILSKILFISFFVFLALFLLYFLKFEYQAFGDSCPIDGLLLKFRLFPGIFPPLFEIL